MRRVKDARYLDSLFPIWRYHLFFTDSDEPVTDADITHRRHAIIETVFSDLIDGPLAHLGAVRGQRCLDSVRCDRPQPATRHRNTGRWAATRWPATPARPASTQPLALGTRMADLVAQHYRLAPATTGRTRLTIGQRGPNRRTHRESEPRSARLAGEIGDGYQSSMPDPELVSAFRDGDGAGKPTQAGFKVCYTASKADGVRTAHALWPSEQLPDELGQSLSTPTYFGQASSLITAEAVKQAVPCGPDVKGYLDRIREFSDVGFDEIYLQQLGPDQDGFFNFFAAEIAPCSRDRTLVRRLNRRGARRATFRSGSRSARCGRPPITARADRCVRTPPRQCSARGDAMRRSCWSANSPVIRRTGKGIRRANAPTATRPTSRSSTTCVPPPQPFDISGGGYPDGDA